MALYLRPTDLPGKPADDYEVFDGNRRPSIGRIMLHPQAPKDRAVVLDVNGTRNPAVA